ncbi:MAG: GNAT family N-acetyltransferase [Alphaproteobacteria bacterium]|nr:GNAT family N-acetyltransferase [Alphaproteobacteria bacterium]
MIMRRAAPGDEQRLAALFSEMQRYYGSEDPPGGALRAAREVVAAQGRSPFALIAERDGEMLGFANLSPIFFGGGYQWLLFLKDLYVAESARFLGVGRALMRAIAREALAGGYRRVDWTTDGANRGAQALYDKMGIPRADKVFYRLGGEDLKALAAEA